MPDLRPILGLTCLPPPPAPHSYRLRPDYVVFTILQICLAQLIVRWYCSASSPSLSELLAQRRLRIGANGGSLPGRNPETAGRGKE